MGKGGARHTKKRRCAFDAFEKHTKLARDLMAYEMLTAAAALDPSALRAVEVWSAHGPPATLQAASAELSTFRRACHSGLRATRLLESAALGPCGLEA